MKKSFKVIAATAGIGTLLWGTTLFASSGFSESLRQKLNNAVVLHAGQTKAYVNGENRIKLNQDNEKVASINVVGNWILYRNKADKYSLYKMKLDGTNKTKISNNVWYVVDAVEVDGTIYYLDKPLDKSFTKLRKVSATK